MINIYISGTTALEIGIQALVLKCNTCRGSQVLFIVTSKVSVNINNNDNYCFLFYWNDCFKSLKFMTFVGIR